MQHTANKTKRFKLKTLETAFTRSFIPRFKPNSQSAGWTTGNSRKPNRTLDTWESLGNARLSGNSQRRAQKLGREVGTIWPHNRMQLRVNAEGLEVFNDFKWLENLAVKLQT